MNEKELAMYIGHQIKLFRTSIGLTQKELAEKLGMGHTTIANYEKGFRSPKKDTLFDLADVFGVSIDDLFPDRSISTSPHSPVATISPKVVYLDQELKEPRHSAWIGHGEQLLKEQSLELREEPLFEYRIYEKLSAGTGTAIYEDHSYDLVYFDKDLDHDIASWIYGDSMEPKYHHGQVALIKETGFDYDGAIYAVVWDGQTYIKKVYREEDGLRLVSLNDKYSDKFAPYDEDPRIIGKIVGNFTPVEN
jgi:phage repressor protein C with HTH and peptisase S24 domain